MRKLSILPLIALFALLTACSDDKPTATTAKKEPEKVEPITGQSALFKMYQMARSWGGMDTQILKMQSIHLSDVKEGAPGTAAAWQATLVSASKGQSRGYTYSIVEGEGNLHKGAFAGPEEGWSGPHGVNAPFPMVAVKVDTDTAYKTAMETPQSKAADYDKKNPGKPITIVLEKVTKYPDPVWRILWGESAGTSNFSVLIDASTGLYLETMR
ncbi:MAG TPA: hypothetical protein VGY58_02795 [Gemmataceae bacterium]|jgi:hypothetical protein|nr:hypothetical protein [Gemmataceae bacterium]